MSLEDIAAFYAAVLATIVAIVQYRQSKNVQVGLSVARRSDYSENLELTITNTQQSRIYIGYCGIGYFYRTWPRLWRRRNNEMHAVKLAEEGCLTGLMASGWLSAGDAMEVYFEKKDFLRLKRPEHRNAFCMRLAVSIGHSRTDKPFLKMIS
jgi:hypothetical protein